MRRIIERVVTVVTTTTWKISWEADPPLAGSTADPVSETLPPLEIVTESTPPDPTVFGTKEVHRPETELTQNQQAEELPDDPDSYPFKKGNENHE